MQGVAAHEEAIKQQKNQGGAWWVGGRTSGCGGEEGEVGGGGAAGVYQREGEGPRGVAADATPKEAGREEERKRGKTHPFHPLLSDDAFRSHGENGKHELPLSQLLRQTLSLASELCSSSQKALVVQQGECWGEGQFMIFFFCKKKMSVALKQKMKCLVVKKKDLMCFMSYLNVFKEPSQQVLRATSYSLTALVSPLPSCLM